ncbi:phage protein Gp36 family protein [Halarcobacter anaerophilus]|jgi:phage gp36-like protein|uniref:phage protein Gp36 family protein n=1 Tax=Halarcobacter anaerophilus TaxID=877500 RepID=UPI0005C90E90|nr:phage protein Gp36 family protein [Halarcobacter anaerophilus]
MITNEDLLKEISQRELTELSDVNGSGELDQNIIDDCINDAISFISSFIIIPTSPTPLLRDIAADLTIVELKKRQGFPKESTKDARERAESMLLKMSAKKIPTDITSSESTKAPTQRKRSFVHNSDKLDLTGL